MNLVGGSFDWATVYLVCFYLGLVMSVLAFASGAGHLHIGHLHFGHVHGGRAHWHGHANGGMSPVNLFTVLVFLCWFGGVGYLLGLTQGFAATTVVILAALSGMLAAAGVFSFLVKVLMPRERVLLPEDTEMRGVIARVCSGVRAGGTGEILFSLNGTRRCAAARTESGEELPRGQQVLVMRYERGVAWVRPWTELEELEALDAPPH
jgi:hypothetical protein